MSAPNPVVHSKPKYEVADIFHRYWERYQKTHPVPVFTLPHELNPLILTNPKTLLNILFRAVKETLLKFGLDPRWHLKGNLGFLSILHTWDQKLNAHYHLHVIIPAGALAPDKSKWIRTKRRKCKKTGILKDFLFHVKALSKAFRGKYLDFLKQAYDNHELKFPKAIQHLAGKENFERFRWSLQNKEWVVYSKAPFKGPESVIGDLRPKNAYQLYLFMYPIFFKTPERFYMQYFFCFLP